ncbi:hypothetical protein GBA63_18920 [Rubrobacter tropicus]|uniref:Uncharacterized protein n=1 Tax=Rubrobacter tropicus TaxID=2653851 RepID=A0A6G8QDG8_9ACTN|nr:hypothetical protein [Rubrobacter tropicus]QIN84482.1 hypothetical protein GBA63_18920 [Rubrobacter tropicus]
MDTSIVGAAGTKAARGTGATGLDWAVAAASILFVGGAWLDAWAHDNLPATLETFFTPWHAILYAGLLAAAVTLSWAAIRNHARGVSWRGALPDGYGLSALGVAAFAAGGVGDMLWHVFFGIEVGLEALLSPTHLLLAAGATLVASGPLRAAWLRPGSRSGAVPLPALLSLGLTVSVLVFFTAYANPFGIPWPDSQFNLARFDFSVVPAESGSQDGPVYAATEGLGRALGVTGILLQAGILMGAMLLAARRWVLPFGAATLVFSLALVPSVFPHGYYLFVPVAVLGGLISDVLLRYPAAGRSGAPRLFAFAAPAGLYALYFAALALTGGLSWPVELWAGTVVLAGAVGMLVAFLAGSSDAPPSSETSPGKPTAA